MAGFMSALTSIFSSAERQAERFAPQDTGGPVVAVADDVSSQLDDRDREEMRKLIEKRKTEDVVIRRRTRLRCMVQRYYMQGNQILKPTSNGGLSIIPSGTYSEGGKNTPRDYEPVYTWNVFRKSALQIMPVLSSGSTTVRFRPSVADDHDDAETARAGSYFAELFERQNDIEDKKALMSSFLWTDGFYLAYTRYVEDGRRFGFTEVPQTRKESVQIRPFSYVCPQCQAVTPQAEAPSMQCPSCGGPLDPQATMAEETMLQDAEGEPLVLENGAVLTDLYGWPEVYVPPSARSQREFGYCGIETEVPLGAARATYPEQADKIRPSGGIGTESDMEKKSWWQIKTGSPRSGAQADMSVTKLMWWMRPQEFYEIEDKERRAKLLKLFPEGCFTCWMGTNFMEARAESMDDYVTVCHAYPGDSQVRFSMGEMMVDPQDALNDLMDTAMRIFRRNIPMLMLDPDLINKDTFRQMLMDGGTTIWFEPKGLEGKGIRDRWDQIVPPGVKQEMLGFIQELFGGITQDFSGALPGLTGETSSDLKTATAYQQARDQALGRLGLPWRAMRSAYVKIVGQAFKQFVKYAGDRQTSFASSEHGETIMRSIGPNDLRGNAEAYAVSDETFPISESDQRAALTQKQLSNNPVWMAAISDPQNFEVVQRLEGLSDIKLPGRGAYEKQMREIKVLIEQEPVQQPVVDPATGQPVIGPDGQPAMQPVSSVPIDPKNDDNQAEFKACQAWLQGKEAWEMRMSKHPGYENVRLHASEHFDAFVALQAPQQPPAGQEKAA